MASRMLQNYGTGHGWLMQGRRRGRGPPLPAPFLHQCVEESPERHISLTELGVSFGLLATKILLLTELPRASRHSSPGQTGE